MLRYRTPKTMAEAETLKTKTETVAAQQRDNEITTRPRYKRRGTRRTRRDADAGCGMRDARCEMRDASEMREATMTTAVSRVHIPIQFPSSNNQ
jgi:hypothetical protein